MYTEFRYVYYFEKKGDRKGEGIKKMNAGIEPTTS